MWNCAWLKWQNAGYVLRFPSGQKHMTHFPFIIKTVHILRQVFIHGFSYLLCRRKNSSYISNWRENVFKVSYGKVQNYCTLHSKTTDSNKKTHKEERKIMGSLLKPTNILMNISIPILLLQQQTGAWLHCCLYQYPCWTLQNTEHYSSGLISIMMFMWATC